ncbi:NucA/NucB deoxyribonuclease domain-containing protein [Streptomyces youssoufiensis]
MSQAPVSMRADSATVKDASGAKAKCNVYNRYYLCQQMDITVHVLKNGKEVGSVSFGVTHKMNLKQTSPKWSESVQFSKAKIVGNARGVLMTPRVSCGNPCKATPKIPKRTLGAAFSGSVDYADAIRKGKSHGTASKYEYTFTKAGYTPGNVSYDSLNYRCDDTFSSQQRPGCVFPKYTPTLTAMKDLPTIAKHIRSVQNRGGHYGRYGSGHPLHRLTDKKKAEANRRAVCGKMKPGKGKSCDEYPFARTHEGGTKLPKASRGVAAVPRGEQNQQGGMLTAFNLKQRVMEREAFWVSV